MKTIQLPGGLQVTFSGLDNEEAYHRAMGLISGATAPLNMVLNILNAVLLIKKTLESATDIPTDPSEFISRLRELTKTIAKIASMAPQFSIPKLIIDLLNVLIDLLKLIQEKVESIQRMFEKKAQVDANISLDPNLETVSISITAQTVLAQNELEEMLAPIVIINNIVTTLSELIGWDIPFPDLSGDLDSLNSQLSSGIEFLENLIGSLS